MPYDKDKIAELVKSRRVAKGITQLELAERTNISIRSVQRIENGSVAPRFYTLRVLAEQLDFDPGLAVVPGTSPEEPPVPVATLTSSRPRRRILSLGLGLVIFIGCIAFLSQSSRFPETNFESLCFWGVVILIYFGLLWRIWK